MIMEWKKQGNEYHAQRQGAKFVLAADAVTGRWHLQADGKKVKQNWSTAHRAMDEIEDRLLKSILSLSKVQEAKHGTAA